MRANYRMQRLFVPQPMQAGGTIEPDPQQAHYLVNVLRMQAGAQLLVFNGMDGEWLAQLAEVTKKRVRLALTTHDEGGLSELDVALAAEAESLAGTYS